MNAPETPPAASEQHSYIPFSIRSTLAFYLSLGRRYRRMLIVLSVFLGLFALFTAVRLAAVGLVLDAVRIHLEASGGVTDGGGAAVGGVPVGSAGDGSMVESFDRLWDRWVPGDAPPPTARLADSDGFWTFLLWAVVSMALVSIGLGAVFFIKETVAISMVARMFVDARRALFWHLTRQTVSYFHNRTAGDLTSRVTNDVDIVQNALGHLFQTVLQQPLIILSALMVAYMASPFLFLISIPLQTLLVIPIIRSGRRVIHHGRRRQHRLGLITEALQQLFSGIRIVKAFGMERHERDEFQKRNEAFGQSYRKTFQAKVTGRTIQEILYSLGLTGLVLLGAYLLTRGEGDLSMGRFFTFVLAMVQVYAPMKTLSKAWNQVQESRAGVERVLELLREEPVLRDRPRCREFPGLQGRIVFDHVGFSYREVPGTVVPPDATKLPVLDDFCLEVRRGEVTALVGPSGSGKTSVVDLLARFYDVQSGAIRIDGVDIRDYRHASYLSNIAIVAQDPFLFNTTIRENIRYGREDATHAEIEEAARAARAHDFIVEQPEGYDTVIGDRGSKLSGGQRQRLTIARALLKNAPILILDEATSSLDSEAEREVQQAIDRLVQDRTSFVIAHRLSTIVSADRIVVLQGGRIVEMGTHEDLMVRRGRYHELYRAQNPEGQLLP